MNSTHITMVESGVEMRALLDCSREQRNDALRRLWQPVAGMYSFGPSEPDLVAVHAQNFGFDPAAPKQRMLDALDSLEKADAWDRIKQALIQGATDLATAIPGLEIPDITVLLLLGDPTNRHFMEELQGLSAFGGISGYIAITIWPTDVILNRLEAIALHELHHNLRYSPGGIVWNPMTVTVGEHVVAEGLADLFAVRYCGLRGYTHFVSEQTRESDDVLRRVCEGLNNTGMQNFAGWVLGDASARLFGSSPAGLPTGAGYAAGTRIVQEYLDATGRTATECLRTPAEEILNIALPRLGLNTRP